MAGFRAEEHRREDRYLEDPFAQVLVPAGERPAVGDEAPNAMVIIRGRLVDETVLSAVEEGVRQIVSLGAGSDTRAYRLRLPGDLHYIEVDLPGQLAEKAGLLEDFRASCRVSRLEVDLRGEWGLEGFDPAVPSLWTVEGVFYYLREEQIGDVLRKITERSVPGSWLAFDVPHPGYLAAAENQGFLRFMAERGSGFTGAMADPAACLARYGWEAEAHLQGDLNGVGWVPPLPGRLARRQEIWFVRARKA
ncbi:SAM-dependent methyltransferase [Actinocorallia longicatena]